MVARVKIGGEYMAGEDGGPLIALAEIQTERVINQMGGAIEGHGEYAEEKKPPGHGIEAQAAFTQNSIQQAEQKNAAIHGNHSIRPGYFPAQLRRTNKLAADQLIADAFKRPAPGCGDLSLTIAEARPKEEPGTLRQLVAKKVVDKVNRPARPGQAKSHQNRSQPGQGYKQPPGRVKRQQPVGFKPLRNSIGRR